MQITYSVFHNECPKNIFLLHPEDIHFMSMSMKMLWNLGVRAIRKAQWGIDFEDVLCQGQKCRVTGRVLQCHQDTDIFKTIVEYFRVENYHLNC